LFSRWLFWPLFAAVMGFAVGASFLWATTEPIRQLANAADRSGTHRQDESIWHWITHDAVDFSRFG
jgi:hypothetical protein